MTKQKQPYYYVDSDFGIYLLILDKEDQDNLLEIRGQLARQEYLRLVSSDNQSSVIRDLLSNEEYRKLEAEFNASLGTVVEKDILKSDTLK